jgi:aryl-alcohol dehydrogenase-like predicted oxidoreductase
MNGLHTLVLQGKVLYLGVSDTPAWVVAQANQYAKDHGKSPFVIYQGKWNVLERSFERDIIPMARAHGMALAPWGVLASGKIRSDEEERQREESGEKGRMFSNPEWKRNESEKKICDALQKVADEVKAKHIGSGECMVFLDRSFAMAPDEVSVAIAYLMQKTTHVFPIVGGRKVEQLMQNIEALDIALTPEQIAYIESVISFDPGFPNSMIVRAAPRIIC